MENRVEMAFRTAVKFFFSKLNKNIPEFTMRSGCRGDVALYCKEKGLKRVLIVTDKVIRGLGALDAIEVGLQREGIEYQIFDDILQNPTTIMCQNGRDVGLEFGADSVIAVGGGSVLDCAKIISSAIAQPHTDIRLLCVILLPHKIIPHIAVPTTSGTGAEVSMGVVISDGVKHQKHTGGSPMFTYDHVFLDAELTVGLPPKATAAFGMDALSHAVESYLSLINDPQGKEFSIEAIKLIFKYLPIACSDGANLEAREKMAYAAMRAGSAMNINYAGLAHPLAHAIGGVYNLPHGNMIAATLVPTLRFEEDACRSKLAELCVACGFGVEQESEEVLSERFISKVEELRDNLGLSADVPQIKEENLSTIIRLTYKDAVFYPLPKAISHKEIKAIIEKIRAVSQ